MAHFHPAQVAHFHPAKVVHFNPAWLVYYDRFLHFGSYVQENMMGLSARITDLSKILENAIEKEISRQMGREGPSL